MKFHGPQALTDTRESSEQAMVCSKNTEKLTGYLAPPHVGVRTIIMIEVVTEEMHGSD